MKNTDQRLWHIGDLHLGHENLAEGISFEGHDYKREKRYEDRLIKAWKHCVSKDDLVTIHGDVAFGREATEKEKRTGRRNPESLISYWFSVIRDLPGQKVLILGNHDGNKVSWYKKYGFLEVVAFGHSTIIRHWMGNILLTHIPADVTTLVDYRFKSIANQHAKEMDANSCILNIHGHTHGKGRETHRTFDCGLEVVGEAPMTLEQILEKKFKSYRIERKQVNIEHRIEQECVQQTSSLC